VQKPNGVISSRVQKVGGEHFAIGRRVISTMTIDDRKERLCRLSAMITTVE
jgi:hypothetical protein